MTFWTVFWACAIAVVVGNLTALLIGMTLGHLKKKSIERKMQAAKEAALATALSAQADAPREEPTQDHGLRPCPFCRSRIVSVIQSKGEDPHDAPNHYFVGCAGCGAYGPPCHHPEEAETAWNAPADRQQI